mgnify:CR=1 FL=1
MRHRHASDSIYRRATRKGASAFCARPLPYRRNLEFASTWDAPACDLSTGCSAFSGTQSEWSANT